MKKIIMLVIVGFISSCADLKEGEIKKVGNNDSIEVFEYNYDDSRHNIIIARFKSKPVVTVNRTIKQNKNNSYNLANIIIENDSIIVIKK